MAGLSVGALILLTCCTFLGQTRADKSFSENILNLMSIYNGNIDNMAQYTAGNSEQNYIQIKLVPVDIPALIGKSVVYVEVGVHGFTYRQQLVELTEDRKDTIYGTPYNFKEPMDNITFGAFNMRDLFTLTPIDLHTDAECKVAFKRAAPEIYVLNWPDCRQTTNGKYPVYVLTFTCGDIVLTPPFKAKEKFTLVPYIFKRLGQRYPLTGAPANYVNACDKRM